MKYAIEALLGTWLLGVILNIAFLATIFYIAYHFISKFW
jgi:hypothetical protein